MAEYSGHPECPRAARVVAHIPMAHVADVERSIAFYSLFGYEPRGRVAEPTGLTQWADLESGSARIMLNRADGPLSPEQEAVIFYKYSRDVRALREHLLAAGLDDASAGTPTDRDRGVVWEIKTPFYMPMGELRVEDPDRYVILIGQLEA